MRPVLPGLEPLAAWYRDLLGWPVSLRTTDGSGNHTVDLVTGVRFDTLHVPLGAGLAVLHRLGRNETGPVATGEGRVWFLVAPSSAEELPGLLEWLDWGGVSLDLGACGAGGRMPAPTPHDATRHYPVPPFRARRSVARRPLPVWVRPPWPGAEDVLPAVGLSGVRGVGSPDLTRLVAAIANACHRSRLFPPTRHGGHRGSGSG